MKKSIILLYCLLFISALHAQNKDSLIAKNSLEITGGTNVLIPIRNYSDMFFGELWGAYYVMPESTWNNFFIYGTYTRELLEGKHSFLSLAANLGYQQYDIKCSEYGYDSGGFAGICFKGENVIEWRNDYVIIALLLTHTIAVTKKICILNKVGGAVNWVAHYTFSESSQGIGYNNQPAKSRFFTQGWRNPNSYVNQQTEYFIFYHLGGTYQVSPLISLGIHIECPLFCFTRDEFPLPMSISDYPTPYFTNIDKLYYLNMGIELSYKLK